MNINIDLSDLIAEFEDLSEIQMASIATSIVKQVTLEIYRNWTDQAKKQLHSTRFEYLRSLQIVDLGVFTKAIVLNGALPNMIESGASPFDMKQSFSKSKKVKYNKKGGWYLTIPFRFATPGALGESEVFVDKLPQEIYNILKKKRSHITTIGGKVFQRSEPILNKELPKNYQKAGERKAIFDGTNKLFDAYQHKSSIYAGIQKSTGVYEKANQGSYNSFRRVGKNSDPLSWIYSGIKAYNLADEAIKNTDIDVISDNVIDSYL